jgi:hypothetical protein
MDYFQSDLRQVKPLGRQERQDEELQHIRLFVWGFLGVPGGWIGAPDTTMPHEG